MATPKPQPRAPRRQYAARDAAITSAMMAAVRYRDNRAEVALRKSLFARGLRYRLYSRHLVGKPDITFVSARVVVFVDGDFWHGRGLIESGTRAVRRQVRGARQDWWVAKLKRTVQRDRHVTRELRRSGWKVLRFWESDVLKDIERVTRRVAGVVAQRASRAGA